MKIWNWINQFLSPKKEVDFKPRATGVRDNEEDYRDLYLGSFQKPVGAPESTDLKTLKQLQLLPQFDQKDLPKCVVDAITKLLIFYFFRKTGKTVRLSPRFPWQICKLFDGVSGPGTYPRIGALSVVKYGCCTEDKLINDTDLSQEKYKNFLMTEEMTTEAKQFRFPGFAFVDRTIESIKEAIHQNGAVVGTTETGSGWLSLPLKVFPSQGPHYTIWCDYETLLNGDVKIYIDNSWGPKWLSWLPNWRYPGKGYFLWSEHKDTVRDIITFTDIPEKLLEETKKAPYKFIFELQAGQMNLAVMELQKLLNENPHTAVSLDGAGSLGNETNFFGTATLNALKKWQMQKGIPATGYFGQLSIKKANERIKSMKLIDALIRVESGGNDEAEGDKHLTHHAYGCLQIRQPAMTDTFPGRRAEECKGNRNLSIEVFNKYMERYATDALIGRPVTDEDRARIWNGGPNGYRSLATVGYWSKVKVLLS